MASATVQCYFVDQTSMVRGGIFLGGHISGLGKRHRSGSDNGDMDLNTKGNNYKSLSSLLALPTVLCIKLSN